MIKELKYPVKRIPKKKITCCRRKVKREKPSIFRPCQVKWKFLVAKCLIHFMQLGECFFWYRPTRVVLDQRPLNGCVCVCVCSFVRSFVRSFLYLISNHTCVLLTCLFLFEFPYMHSWLELPMPTFSCFKPHVHY